MANKKTRMYEPWGYQEENNYNSTENVMESDFEAFLVGASYNKDDNKIYFTNKDGEQKATLDVSEFVKSDSIVEEAKYEDGKIIIKFTNGDVITINVEELIDENEFVDGLQVIEGQVSVKRNAESDDYFTVDADGIKIAGIKADIDTEQTRAEGEEQRIESKLGNEIARAISAETALDAKIDQEIANRTADVDAEEARATSEEQRIEVKLDREITRAKEIEQSLNSELDSEEVAREAGDAALGVRIDNEISDRKTDVNEEETRAEAAEQALGDKIDQEIADRTADVDAEEARATSAETVIINTIDELDEAKADKASTVASAEYVSADTKIYFKDIDGNTISEIDASDFIKDGMISDVKIEDGYLVITFNTDSGKEDIKISLTDIFNPANYYDKNAIDGIVSGISEDIANEAATRVENDEALSQSIEGEKTRAEEKETALQASIDAEAARAISAETDLQDAINLKANSADVYTKGEVDGKDNALQAGIDANAAAISAEEAARIAADEAQDAIIATKADASAVTESIEAEAARAISAETDLQDAIDLKADKETTYTQEEVNALIKAKETEIYNLTKLVGEIGGNVTYTYPNELGTSLTSLLNNYGTVKLAEDATISRFGPGVTAKNKVTINLNGHTLTSTSAGGYGAIMSRGSQEITITGSTTTSINAGDGICIEANGKDSVINLVGKTTYETNRPGGELIYCYAGTINISAGTFKNNGSQYLLNCYDANYAAGTANIIVTGGSFYDFNPADNSAEGEHTSFVPEGYHIETSTDGDSTVYTVKKDA